MTSKLFTYGLLMPEQYLYSQIESHVAAVIPAHAYGRRIRRSAFSAAVFNGDERIDGYVLLFTDPKAFMLTDYIEGTLYRRVPIKCYTNDDDSIQHDAFAYEWREKWSDA